MRRYLESLLPEGRARHQVTLLGVHVRRTDYISHLATLQNASSVDAEYYPRAVSRLLRELELKGPDKKKKVQVSRLKLGRRIFQNGWICLFCVGFWLLHQFQPVSGG